MMHSSTVVVQAAPVPSPRNAFFLSLLEPASLGAGPAAPLSHSITLIQDNACHLPCPLSKTWRKQHGWSDLDDSRVPNRRWEGGDPTTNVATRPASPDRPSTRSTPQAPSPPQRQSSLNSYSSFELEDKIRHFQRDKTSNHNKNNEKKRPASQNSKYPPAFQYPPVFMSSSTLSTAASTFASLELVPEDDVTVESSEDPGSLHSYSQHSFPHNNHRLPRAAMPPRRTDSGSSTSTSTASTISSTVPIKMPQRQLSEQSFHSIGTATSSSYPKSPTKTRNPSERSRSDHVRTSIPYDPVDSCHHHPSSSNKTEDPAAPRKSSSAHSRLISIDLPPTLMQHRAPPMMPQRQESFSTVGSRTSTLASQDSVRSLLSGSVSNVSNSSHKSTTSSHRSTNTTTSTLQYRGSCPLIAEALAAHHGHPTVVVEDDRHESDDDDDIDDDIDDDSTAVPYTPTIFTSHSVGSGSHSGSGSSCRSVDEFLSKHKPLVASGTNPPSLAGTTVSSANSNNNQSSSSSSSSSSSAHRRSTNPQITAFLNPLQQGKAYAGKPLAII